MKTLIAIIAVLFMFGCATVQPIPQQGADLQSVIEQLRALNKTSIETKRIAAIAVLEHVVFDIGFWEVMIETSQYKQTPNVSKAMSEIIRLAKKRVSLPEGEELSDYELSQTLGWSLVMAIGVVKHMSRDIAPQMAQLLALF